MKVRFLFTRGAKMDRGTAIPGLIVDMRVSEAALFSAGGYGRVLKEGEAEPKKKAKKAPAPRAIPYGDKD